MTEVSPPQPRFFVYVNTKLKRVILTSGFICNYHEYFSPYVTIQVLECPLFKEISFNKKCIFEDKEKAIKFSKELKKELKTNRSE